MTPASPQRRLHQLAEKGQLGQLQAPNLESARQLQSDAELRARGAEALTALGHSAGALLVAYESARKIALALLLAHGWRPQGREGEHRTTFEAAQLLVHGETRRALEDAQFLRGERNDNTYRQERPTMPPPWRLPRS